MQYFRRFKRAINLSENVYYELKQVNYSDKLLDSIYSRQDIDSLSKVINQVEDKSLITKFIGLFQIYCSKDDVKLLECIFQVIEKVDFTAFDNILLIIASKYEYLEIVKYLIENGADLHAKNNCTLRQAAYRGYLEVVKYLV